MFMVMRKVSTRRVVVKTVMMAGMRVAAVMMMTFAIDDGGVGMVMTVIF
mgnify:CR=1 FL=1